MTIKQHIIYFVLFLYNTQIKEDWDEWNEFGKILIYPFWLIRAIFIVIFSPFYIPLYFIKQSSLYRNFSKSYNNFLTTGIDNNDIYKNKIVRNNFINNKYRNKGDTFKFKNNLNQK